MARASLRVTLGGALAMAVTALIGSNSWGLSRVGHFASVLGTILSPFPRHLPHSTSKTGLSSAEKTDERLTHRIRDAPTEGCVTPVPTNLVCQTKARQSSPGPFLFGFAKLLVCDHKHGRLVGSVLAEPKRIVHTLGMTNREVRVTRRPTHHDTSKELVETKSGGCGESRVLSAVGRVLACLMVSDPPYKDVR